jgi:hypothetical protein
MNPLDDLPPCPACGEPLIHVALTVLDDFAYFTDVYECPGNDGVFDVDDTDPSGTPRSRSDSEATE